jgi:hypothetical protein
MKKIIFLLFLILCLFANIVVSARIITPGLKGDISISPSGPGMITLSDAIVGLQCLCEENPAGLRPDYVTSGVDVNGDGIIGPEEVIYILQILAGIR